MAFSAGGDGGSERLEQPWCHRGKRDSEVLRLTHAKRLYLETQRPRRRFRIFVTPGHPKIVCVPQDGNLAQARKRIFEDLQPLGRKLGCDFADAGDSAPGRAKLSIKLVATGSAPVIATTGTFERSLMTRAAA